MRSVCHLHVFVSNVPDSIAGLVLYVGNYVAVTVPHAVTVILPTGQLPVVDNLPPAALNTGHWLQERLQGK
jgi:hypothetical protein